MEYRTVSQKCKIAIIDSGISKDIQLSNIVLNICIRISEDGNMIIKNNEEDKIGHGTAVASLICHNTKDVDFYIVKAFDDECMIDEKILINALSYCVDTIQPDIIHMSNGITFCENLFLLKEICERARDNGIIIVSALDNYGAISYPAAIESVVGVDVSDNIKKGYAFVDRKDINYVVPNKSWRLPGKNGKYFSSNGTSFNSCIITSKIADLISCYGMDRNNILGRLKENADFKYASRKEADFMGMPCVKSAVIFPFNKEMHSLIRFQHILSFEIKKVCDVKYTRNIGKAAERLLEIDDLNDLHIIESYENLNWESDFDTFILGHIKEIEHRTSISYVVDIVNHCLKHNKDLISFGDFSNCDYYKDLFRKHNLTLYIPQVKECNVPDVYHGKLRKIGIPIIGIFGTSSIQGKFSLQVQLRNYFEERNYNVGCLGTEPSSGLFGFEAVFPMGYESTVETKGRDNIAVINKMLSAMEDDGKDIIIVGSQSQTMPQNMGNLQLYCLEQHEFLLATDADGIILCVNLFDDEEYVKKTINYIEALVGDVIGIVLFPMEREAVEGILTNKLIKASCEKVKESKSLLENKFRKPVYVAGMNIDKLGKMCEDYFTY